MTIESKRALLTVSGLSAGYGEAIAVRSVDLEVASEEICVVVGSNGAGKTTLVRAISGFERWESGRRTSGSVRFDGSDISNLRPSRIVARRMRLVPERVSTFLGLTVQENLRLAMSVARKSEIQIESIYELFPILKDRQKQVANLLSGGERQMLGIASGLLSGPSLLIVDEPSTGLAPAAVEEVFATLAALRARIGLTLLIVEQNVPAALTIADSICVLRGGEIVHRSTAEGTTDHIDDIYDLMTGRERRGGTV